MANGGVAQRKLLQTLPYFIRQVHTAPSPFAAVPQLNFEEKSIDPAITTTQVPVTEVTTGTDQIINLDDVKVLFSKVLTTKLLKSSATLQMAAFGPMVDMGMWVMNSRLMKTPILKDAILAAVDRSFYEHFVAGKDLEEVGCTIARLWDAGLRGMLDYGLEHATDDESCDRNTDEFIKTIAATKSLPPSSVSFVVVKITAICPPSLLRRVSDLLRWEYKNDGFHLPWKIKTFPVLTDSSPLYHTPNRPQPLTPEEERALQLSHERLFKICESCVEANVPLMIDAEDTALQPAIDYLTYSSAILYHKDDDPVVYGTIQTYLKDSKERLIRAKQASDELKAPIGFKLVRGAYMSSERGLAAALGVDSPIHNNIEQTHASFNGCAAYLLEEVVAKGTSAVVLATHNVESGKLAAAKAIDLGIPRQNQRLQFAQLYGMADSLSFGLNNAGFQVSKYLPFGPVEQIMPYLLRRAEENRGLLSTSYLDRQLMRKELMRRFKTSFVGENGK